MLLPVAKRVFEYLIAPLIFYSLFLFGIGVLEVPPSSSFLELAWFGDFWSYPLRVINVSMKKQSLSKFITVSITLLH